MSGWNLFEVNAATLDSRRQRMLRVQLWALAPVLLAAVLNTGYQYLQLAATAPEASDLRGRLAQLLVANPEQPGVYDWIAAGLAHLLPVLAIALLAGGFWERIIAIRCQRPMESGYILIAVLFSLLLPGAAPWWHIVFGMSLAILLGKGIFGGDGKTFLSPALLGIAIVQVSFPGAAGTSPLWTGISGYAGADAIAVFARGGESALAAADINLWRAFLGATPGPMGTTSELAVLIGAGLLLAQVIGLGVVATLFNLSGAESGAATLALHWHLLLGSFLFGAVFLACDPFASCSTNPGRWIQGLFIGALIVLLRVANSTHPDAVVPAILLGSILAPLIDHAVIAFNIRQRASRRV